jgi:putative flippase GtrA
MLKKTITRQPHKISHQLLLYAIVAAVGLAVDFATLYVLKEYIGWHYLIATTGGFLLGLVVTYLLSNWAVFGQPRMSEKQAFLLFGVIGVIGLLILNALVWFLTDVLSLYYLISKSIATVFVFFWNFFARRSLYNSPTPNDSAEK